MAYSTDKSKQRVDKSKLTSAMTNHPELIGLAIAVTCTVLTNFTHSLRQKETAVYQVQPPPKHFFGLKSVVLDFPFGNLNNVGTLLDDEEALYVMFYAPWCAKCMHLRDEYEKAALYMRNELTFVAINCWYGKGQCRQKNDFQTFPVFYLYFTRRDGFRYSGVPSADNLVKFAEVLMQPLRYLTSEEELVLFLSQHDGAVIGYFDFDHWLSTAGFQQFYYSSMRTYEADPYNSIRYGVITQARLAKTFGMETTKTVYYCRTLNDTLKYPKANNLTMTALTKWVRSLISESSVKWILPSGMKSAQLADELSKGPAVLAFVPDAPLLAINQYHSMLREVVMLYKNCAGDNKWSEMAHSSQYARWINLVNHFNAMQNCKNYQIDSTEAEIANKLRMPHKQCCLTLNLRTGTNNRSCDACLNYQADSALAGRDCQVLSLHNVVPTDDPAISFQSLGISQYGCTALQPNYNPTEFVTFCCDESSSSATSLAPKRSKSHLFPVHHKSEKDPFVVKYSENIIANTCRKLNLQRDLKWLPAIDVTDLGFHNSELSTNITELGCDSNRSLNFYTFNAAQSDALRRGLGVMPNQTDGHIHSTVVIVDIKNEFQHKMSETFSKQNIAHLIGNFTEGNLTRHLRSADAPVRSCDKSQVCIVEVTTNTFHSVVMDPGKDVVLLYYAPWCGYCARFTHIYLTIAKYFKSATNITFARINADKSDLPWQYTVDTYPTIVIYPAYRKDASEVFPEHLQKKVSTLVLFVLKYATHSVKLQTSLEICSKACMAANVNSSLTRLQTLSREIDAIRHKLSSTQTQIKSFEIDESSLSNKQLISLRRRAKLLSLMLSRKHLQEKHTRTLYNSLQTSTGQRLGRHKMLSILKQHILFEGQYKAILESFANNIYEYVPDR